MMRRRGTILILLSLTMGILAAMGANSWVKGRLAAEGSDPSIARLTAAAMTIPYGTKIDSRHLRMVELPADAIPEGAVLNIEDAIGKVATVDIQRGELMIAGRLADHKGGSTLASLVQESMRAITVRVDDVAGVAGFLLPGNFVDVVSSRLDPKTRRANTETVLKNLKVLAVDQTASTNGNDPVIVRAVTLEVSPAQSEVLVKAKQEGAIQLTLRNPNEAYVAEAPVVEEKKAVPAPAPRRSWTPTSTEVQVIRGTRIEQTKARI
jgi:pilus assembly protein CpaB